MSSKTAGRISPAGFLAGILITAGFWFGADIYRYLVPPTVSAPQPPVVIPPSPVASTQSIPNDAEKKVSPSRALPRTVRKEDVKNVLADLAQTCAFWSARDGDRSGRVFRDRACAQMRQYAAETRQPVPSIHVRPAPRIERNAPSRTQMVAVNQCERFDYGSVRYRQCRANESARLREMCQFHRQRDEWQAADPWCAAYENYQVVD